jgi:predicted DCC family thiol-disulfide oxidoreductase YuxK
MTVLDRAIARAAVPAIAPDAPARPSRFRTVINYLQDAYSLDLRSLALFRIALGAVLLGDLIVRASDLTVFYTDFGVLPRAALLDKFSPAPRFSIHLMSGQLLVEGLLFLLAGVFALMLLFGVRTRLATFASWFMLVSIQTRNPAILQGGDVYLRMLTFIGIFLPLGALYSVDAALAAGEPEEKRSRAFRYFSTPGLALIVQVGLVYAFAALLKTAPEWRTEHSAVYYALSIQQMSTPFGRFLLHFPKLLPWLTRGTLVQEGILPLFVLTPILAGPARLLAVLQIVAFHTGLGLSIRLGHFPYIACMAAVPLLPTWFWERAWVQRLMPWSTGKATAGLGVRIYYDGECSFCSKLVRILRTFLIVPKLELIPAQEFPVTELEMHQQRSWILVESDGQRFYRWQAAAQLVSHSPVFSWLAPLMRWGAAAKVGERWYAGIEEHRKQLSRHSEWIKGSPLNLNTSPAVTVFALLLIAYISLWNLSSVTRIPFQPWQDAMGVTLDLDQRWDMFSPNPLTYDGWYAIEGHLRDGRSANVLHPRQPFTYEQPASIADEYKNERWRKYLMNLSLPENTEYRLYYGRYLCRSWNVWRSPSDPATLMSFEIYFMAHQNSITRPPTGFSRDLLWHHECFK